MAPLDAIGLPPVTAESPAGENLELDAQFGELERAAQGKPEVQYGSTIEAAVPPDWKETIAIAEALNQRTHDLRILVHLAIARLNMQGIPEFAAAVRLIRQQLEDCWAEVHPQLDPEDDNDPLLRSNAVFRLRDPARVQRPLRDTPLATAKLIGPVTWRDIAVLNGSMEAEPGREKKSESEVVGIFSATDQARLEAVRDGVDSLLTDVVAISAAFDHNASVGSGPNYEDLIKLLRDIQRELRRFEQAATPAEGDAAAADAGDEPAQSARASGPGRSFASIQAITALTKREDALHALQLAASYFRTQEPSSPLPLLIDRASRLAGMEFMDILRDLAPDGLSQAQTIAGTTTE